MNDINTPKTMYLHALMAYCRDLSNSPEDVAKVLHDNDYLSVLDASNATSLLGNRVGPIKEAAKKLSVNGAPGGNIGTERSVGNRATTKADPIKGGKSGQTGANVVSRPSKSVEKPSAVTAGTSDNKPKKGIKMNDINTPKTMCLQALVVYFRDLNNSPEDVAKVLHDNNCGGILGRKAIRSITTGERLDAVRLAYEKQYGNETSLTSRHVVAN